MKVLLLIRAATVVTAGYHGSPEILDEHCACVLNCDYCRLPAVLTSLSSSSHRGFCQDPSAQPNDEIQWVTLRDADGNDGHCRKADGGHGDHATIDHVVKTECESLCARTTACVAYEFSDKCELHTSVPTTVSASPSSGGHSNCDCGWANGGATCGRNDNSYCWGVCCGGGDRRLGDHSAVCRVKDPLPVDQPPIATSPLCCPTFDGKVEEVKDDVRTKSRASPLSSFPPYPCSAALAWLVIITARHVYPLPSAAAPTRFAHTPAFSCQPLFPRTCYHPRASS